MTRVRSSSTFETVAVLLVFGAIALTLRIGISFRAVFGHDFVKFIEPDAWYHMRLVDATVRHFPHRIWFDPYLVGPGGEWVNAGPFFDWVIAAIALIVGLGSPSSHLVDVVGAYVPPVMGALLVLPVYVLGRELFSRGAGLWAAFFVGILPGQIMLRSLLGFTDHHCAETLLSTMVMMWLVLALDPLRPLARRLWLSAAAGATLGCYLLTWGGGSLFVLIVVAAASLSLVLQRLRLAPTDNLPVILSPAFAVAAVMTVPWSATRPYFAYDLAGLAGGVLLLFALRGWGAVTARYRHGVLMYFAGLAASAGLCLAVA
jgi:asparagine N-glycosylation enzyme membrane subunit Stt3